MPLVGSTIRFTMRSSVVLPEPEVPTRARTVPAATLNETESTATVPPG